MSPCPGETDYDKQKKGGREKERADTYFIMRMGRGGEEERNEVSLVVSLFWLYWYISLLG